MLSVTTIMLLAAAAQSASADSFICGKPGALCGASLPAAVTCSKGPGYCDPGYFCGWNFSDTDKTTKCMPVPKDCGKEGKSCCPGNDVKSITDTKTTPKPYCKDGSYCFYTPTPDASGWSSPPYSSPANLIGTCHQVPRDCGSATGKPCCPSTYRAGVNPAFPSPSMNSICSGKLFCQYTAPGSKGYNPEWASGTCVENKPDCGKFGKPCCIITTGVSTNTACGAKWNEQGEKGYCAYPGGKVTADMRDQVCLNCPSMGVVAGDPGKFFPCPTQ